MILKLLKKKQKNSRSFEQVNECAYTQKKKL